MTYNKNFAETRKNRRNPPNCQGPHCGSSHWNWFRKAESISTEPVEKHAHPTHALRNLRCKHCVGLRPACPSPQATRSTLSTIFWPMGITFEPGRNALSLSLQAPTESSTLSVPPENSPSLLARVVELIHCPPDLARDIRRSCQVIRPRLCAPSNQRNRSIDTPPRLCSCELFCAPSAPFTAAGHSKRLNPCDHCMRSSCQAR